MAKVLARNLRKNYGKVTAVRDFNLEIGDGEFVVFVGPSGCGKTTTLRMIAGLEDIDEGEIHIGQRIVNDLAPKDRNVAMVFQNYALYPHMDVYRNMAFGLKLRKVQKDEIDQRVRKAAKILGLDELLRRKPKQLSGGQMQRVALGRAIVRDPDVFLFDEPLSNLDAKLRTQMRNELAKLHHQLKTTMIYVTHDQIEAMTLGDRIVVMKDGLMQQVGTPYEVYSNPRNLFVAGFIGSPTMNFLEGILTRRGSELVFEADSVDLSLKGLEPEGLKERINKPVILGIRPDHVNLVEGPDASSNAILATIEVIELLGAETLLLTSIREATVTAKIQGGSKTKVGEKAGLHFDLSHAHLFDMESGECLTS